MDVSTLTEQIKGYIEQSLAGADIENPKFDFKREWYNLKTEASIHEFLKDTSSIANTFGKDGYIVIGYDEKAKTFTRSVFSDCQLRDSSEMMGIIAKHVEPMYSLNTFDIDYKGNLLSIIHIPPSLNKPHVVRNHKRVSKNQSIDDNHRIFVRRGTTSVFATRNDIELMYYDRKNIEPDYALNVNAHPLSTKFGHATSAGEILSISLTIKLIIENIGRRPIAITKTEIRRAKYSDDYDWQIVDMVANHPDTLVVPQNVMINYQFQFFVPGRTPAEYKKIINRFENCNYLSEIKSIKFHLSNGNFIETQYSEF